MNVRLRVRGGDRPVSLLADDLPDRPARYYHFYDPGDDDLPDGQLTRFVIRNGVLTADQIISLPDG